MENPIASVLQDQRLFNEVFAKFEKNRLDKQKELELEEKEILNLVSGTKSGIITPDMFDNNPKSKAIIMAFGRPALLIKNNTFELPESDVWKERLLLHQSNINKAIVSTGRIELRGHDQYPWVGTGWVIAENVIVTNRHVAQEFVERKGEKFVFSKNKAGASIQAFINFNAEHQSTSSFEFEIDKIIHMEKKGGDWPDLAFLKIKNNGDLPLPISVSDRKIRYDDLIATIGYPAFDLRNSETLMDKVFEKVYDVKRLLPGRVIDVPEYSFIFRHDCSTLGGNSGSVVIDLETGQALGLHFSGTFKQANLAVKASILLEKLSEHNIQIQVSGSEKEELSIDETLLEVPLDDRKGYNPSFLPASQLVPLPRLSDRIHSKGLVVSKNSTGIERFNLKYTHFSIVMNRERKFPYYAACNIDGTKTISIPRSKSAGWRIDRRLLQSTDGVKESHQFDNRLYKNNDLGRGHIVKRTDPVWGSPEEAQKANDDTFFYTNSCPQHNNFNQGKWLELENWIRNNTKVHNLKISVFTGPVFKESDMEYRGAQIPAEYWKVIAMMVDEPKGPRFSATAYLLSQEDQLDNFESPFAFGSYKTYQISISEIEQLTGLDFGEVKNGDPMHGKETISRKEIRELEEIIL